MRRTHFCTTAIAATLAMLALTSGCATRQPAITEKPWHTSPIAQTGSVWPPGPVVMGESPGIMPLVPWDLAEEVRIGMKWSEVEAKFRARGHQPPTLFHGQRVFYSSALEGRPGVTRPGMYEIAVWVGDNGRVKDVSFRGDVRNTNWNATITFNGGTARG